MSRSYILNYTKLRKIFTLIFILLLSASSAQKEANIWYFGQNAGLDFNSGSPVALTNGQLSTYEGCATISTSSGQLLFYTDGITVYNKNHTIMVNGTGLMGDPSSAQSATIVQKPGSTNLFYIFTTDNEHDPNGFRYSVVDMNLNGGNGAVTSDKNVLVYTPTIENLGVTKHGNGQDFWIVTHGWDSNSFITYQLTSAGLNLNPVVTNIGQIITGSPTDYLAAGTIKISPSGTKLAFTSVSDIVQLFDFNNTTGILSNVKTLLIETGELMSAAFSPDESLLYVTNTFGKIHQFNLNTADIPNSKITIYSGNLLGQIQVGPDNKIYVAFLNRTKLGVINNPNIVGLGCNFQLDGVDLAGRISKLGLPSFNQSFFFSPSILLSSTCEGESSSFSFSTNQTVLSATWDFGDGLTSTDISPTHTYLNSNNYTVSVTVVTPLGTGSNTRQVIIHPKPILLTTTVTLKQCDDNTDGFSAFNLNQAKNALVSSETGLIFSFHETQADATNNVLPIGNPTQYANQIVSNDAVFVRVQNQNGCFKTATLNLAISTTNIPPSFSRTLTECDNLASGSNTDGITTFDFTSTKQDVLNLFPVGQALDVSFYKNVTDALSEQNAILNIGSYSNIGSPNSQNIWVRVESQTNNDCVGLGQYLTLIVDKIPIIQPLTFKNCDDNQDGIVGFDTSNLASTLLNGRTNISLSYSDQNNIAVTMTNPFVTNSRIINIKATNDFGKQCEFTTTVSFIVSTLPQMFPIATTLTTLCDDEVDPINQDGIINFDTSGFQSTLLGNQTGMMVIYFDANNNPIALTNPFKSGTQNIKVEVVNASNLNCKASGIISFVVNTVPKISLSGTELVCSNNPNFTKIIDGGLADASTASSFTYEWFKNDVLIPSQNSYTLTVNAEGIYKVKVSNNLGCSRTRTIAVSASEIAKIDNVIVTDLSDINIIQISASGLGSYEYSLDDVFYQDSNTFSNIIAGNYTVYVRDKKDCGIAKSDVSVLGIPKFFTPNGDNYNDNWNIKGVNQRLNNKTIINIFDRFGKLVYNLDTRSQGWDGTHNGQPVPADDYWYAISMQDGRVLKGHFALKR